MIHNPVPTAICLYLGRVLHGFWMVSGTDCHHFLSPLPVTTSCHQSTIMEVTLQIIESFLMILIGSFLMILIESFLMILIGSFLMILIESFLMIVYFPSYQYLAAKNAICGLSEFTQSLWSRLTYYPKAKEAVGERSSIALCTRRDMIEVVSVSCQSFY